MEGLELEKLFKGIYKGKRVLLTGHTGFKGSWMLFWLNELGAEVLGYSVNIPSQPNHFELLDKKVKSVIGDIRNRSELIKVFIDFQPEIVFHMAAQPLVRYSYKNPIETLETNIIGTANVLEAVRTCASVRAVVVITSDKCYENLETDIAYKETDKMGGYDPYSVSKGCAELIANSYRSSFYNLQDYKKKHHVLLASGRAGNVIGGGDWAEDRLIPDIVRNSSMGNSVVIRNPNSTRPWQHVLEPLSGYLLLGQELLLEKTEVACGWNFGPYDNETLKVSEVLNKMLEVWQGVRFNFDFDRQDFHEASLLKLDCSKANSELAWFPVWDTETAIVKTAFWYKNFYEGHVISSSSDLEAYVSDARSKQISWAL